MKKVLLYLLALPVVMLLLASCHSEEDDFIDRPDTKSLIIKGVAKTPDGHHDLSLLQPLLPRFKRFS